MKMLFFSRTRLVPYGNKRLDHEFALELKPASDLPLVSSFRETPALSLVTDKKKGVVFHFGEEDFGADGISSTSCYDHIHNRISKIYVTISGLSFCSILDSVPFSKSGNAYLLTVIDHNSKFLHAIPVRNKKLERISLALKRLLPTHLKIPNAILTDRGLEFTGRVEELLSEYNIKHLTTRSYTPWGNGGCERANKTISDLLRSSVTDPKIWDEHLPKVISTYNNTHHTELNMSPASYILNTKHEVTDRPLIPRTDFKFWVRGHEKFRPFDVGELVIKKIVRTSDKVAHKLDEKYSGPYKVNKVFANNLTYEIKSCLDGKIIQVYYHYLRPWKTTPDYLKNTKLFEIFYSTLLNEICRTDETILAPIQYEQTKEQEKIQITMK
ncbi:Retrovirus-related Pol polyprotein from transposon [Armadillidium vulgare]|nr:Retrovirus-related Pol polyprotein from transposon [Armadillidium vulgare]